MAQIKKYTLYTLSDPITNEIRYVGQTSMTLNRRLICHLSKKEKTHKKDWLNSLVSKGLKPIISEVSSYFSQEEINVAEINLIAEYKSKGLNLTNLAIGGNVTTGYKFTEEQKQKMRGRKPHNFNKKISEEQKKEISNSLKEFYKINPKKGIACTEEHKRKIGEKNSKKVALIDDNGNIIKIFNSATQAAIEMKLKKSSVAYVCQWKRNSVFKNKFIYI